MFELHDFCDVQVTGPDAQCSRKPPSLLLVLLEEVFSEDTTDVLFCIIYKLRRRPRERHSSYVGLPTSSVFLLPRTVWESCCSPCVIPAHDIVMITAENG